MDAPCGPYVTGKGARRVRAAAWDGRSLEPRASVSVCLKPCAMARGEQEDTRHDSLYRAGSEACRVVDVGWHTNAEGLGHTGDDGVVGNIPAQGAGGAAHAHAA